MLCGSEEQNRALEEAQIKWTRRNINLKLRRWH